MLRHLVPFALFVTLIGCASDPTSASDTADTACTGDTGPGSFPDADGDGFGDAGGARAPSCDVPDGYGIGNEDCDDSDAAVHPNAAELCNGRDDNCDGSIDEGAPGQESGWLDLDGDGYGDPAAPLTQCDGAQPLAANSGDCDDARDDVHPDATETCDGLDQDCDGVGDDLDAVDVTTWYPDNDVDGFGTAEGAVTQCTSPGAMWATVAGDCNDDADDIRPGATEVCHDGVDQDCSPGGAGCERRGSWTVDDPAGVDVTLVGDSGSQIGDMLAGGDVNGDGVAELALGSTRLTEFGRAWVLRGPVTSSTTLSDAVLGVDGDSHDRSVGSTVALLADRDGDGIGQVLIGDYDGPDSGDSPGAAYLFTSGGHLGTADAEVSLHGADPYGIFAYFATDVGDVDGDGVTDLAIGAPEANSRGTGEVYIWFGVPTADASAETADVTLTCLSGSLGTAARGGFDWDGDGLDDLAVSAPESDADGGSVYVLGGPLSPGERYVADGTALATITHPTFEAWAGWDLAALGDTDGDGLDDLAVAAPWAGGEIGVFGGGGSGAVPWSAAIGTISALGTYDSLGYHLAAGDLDGDGVRDLVASAPTDTVYGAVGLWYGPLTGSHDANDAGGWWTGVDENAGLSGAAVVADFTGDGVDDVAMGAYNAGVEKGEVYIAAGWGE